MYSDNFVRHMFQKSNQLILIQRNKRVRAHEKLDYNLKRMLDHLPKQLKELSIEQLIKQFDGDLDTAANKLVKIDNNVKDRMYDSPPKNGGKVRNIKKKNVQCD